MSPKQIRMLETREISPDGVVLQTYAQGRVYAVPGAMTPHAAEIALANGWAEEVADVAKSTPKVVGPEETKVVSPTETKPARRGRRGEA